MLEAARLNHSKVHSEFGLGTLRRSSCTYKFHSEIFRKLKFHNYKGSRNLIRNPCPSPNNPITNRLVSCTVVGRVDVSLSRTSDDFPVKVDMPR